jgi:hypothetical protein
MSFQFILLKDLKVGDIILRQVNPYSFSQEEVCDIVVNRSRRNVYIKNVGSPMFVLSGEETQIVMKGL